MKRYSLLLITAGPVSNSINHFPSTEVPNQNNEMFSVRRTKRTCQLHVSFYANTECYSCNRTHRFTYFFIFLLQNTVVLHRARNRSCGNYTPLTSKTFFLNFSHEKLIPIVLISALIS